jgi:acetylornithine deacetylase
MNIGLIAGGRAPNVISDEATAAVLYRTVDGGEELRRSIETALDGSVEYEIVRQVAPMCLERLPGYDTDVVPFTSDLANLDRWGRPLLIGPGSVFAAHTAGERVRKAELVRAAELYRGLVVELKARAQEQGESK